jgi:hypothetical protein
MVRSLAGLDRSLCDGHHKLVDCRLHHLLKTGEEQSIAQQSPFLISCTRQLPRRELQLIVPRSAGPFRVKSAVLAVRRSLPVFPDESLPPVDRHSPRRSCLSDRAPLNGIDRRRRSTAEIGMSLRIRSLPERLRYRSVRLVAVIPDIVGVELALTCIPPILAVLRWWSHNRRRLMARSAATVTAGFAAIDGDAALGRAAGAAMVANGGLRRGAAGDETGSHEGNEEYN